MIDPASLGLRKQYIRYGDMKPRYKSSTYFPIPSDFISNGAISYENTSAFGLNNLQPVQVYYASMSYDFFFQERGKRHYELTNHLGNVLTVISDKRILVCNADTVTYSYASIISATDYSPFGAPLAGRTFSSESYRFRFNGMENDSETYGDGNALDFGARIYDSRLGRWLSVDPLKEKYTSFSPYCFATNKPIMFMDFDGRDIILTTQFYNSGYKNALIKLLDANTTFTNTYIVPFTIHGKDVRLDYFSFSLNGQTTTAPCKNNGRSNANYTDSRFGETSNKTREITGKEAIFFNSDAVFTNDFDPTTGAPIHSSGEQGGVFKGNFITENFMLVIVMHEFMHANLVTHEEMASESNITLVANSLMKIDPNLSSVQANALAWTGLEDTDAWRAKSDTERKGILEQIGALKRGNPDTTITENNQREGMEPDQNTKTVISKNDQQ